MTRRIARLLPLLLSVACARSAAPDVYLLGGHFQELLLRVEPFTHGKDVVVTEATLAKLPPVIRKDVENTIRQYFPTARLCSRVKDCKSQYWLGLAAGVKGTEAEVRVEYHCGPICGDFFVRRLRWDGRDWHIEDDSRGVY